ncbi:MAG: succinate dehydrogenase cytochrome b558 subunit [Planctomycetota bacterium]
MSEPTPASAFFIRHEFAIRRLHSLTGIVPLGAYMCVHLVTNASLLNGPETFQRAVFTIHSLGRLLPLVEWGFIFGPLLFHAILGVWIVKTGKSNTSSYQFASNKRYRWQRWTGMIGVAWLFFHVLHLHGWFHAGFWLAIVEPAGMAQFRPYNAASTLMSAMQGYVWPAFYLAGVLSLVFHLANGIWTAGITWGLWISPKAQQRATKVCTAFGLGLALVGTSAWWGAVSAGQEEIKAAEVIEDEMYEAALKTGLAYDMPHKRTHGEEVDTQSESKKDDSTSASITSLEERSLISKQSDSVLPD